MAEYRRLISYIYEYEGTEKGRNVGFVKLEARNGLCRLNVNVKKVFAGGNETGVYLISTQRELFLGKLFLRNGAGEFHTTVSVADVEESGISMESCLGLTIHEREDGWHRYTTVWEDSAPQTAKADSTRQAVRGDSVVRTAGNLALNGVRKAETVMAQELDVAIGEETVEEPPQEMPDRPVEEPSRQPVSVPSVEEPPRQPVSVPPVEEPPRQPVSVPPVKEPTSPVLSPARVSEPQEERTLPVSSPASASESQENQVSSAPPTRQDAFLLGDPAVLQKLEEEEAKEKRLPVWDYLAQNYPKIQAFDSALPNIALIIKPQDIGLLPRELWNYGNNSFLLHGYYNYRYLLLAKLSSLKGNTQYVLGVPGNYYSNEKYMAAMFGFPHFVLSRRQTTTDGRFGYWYTPIRLEGGHVSPLTERKDRETVRAASGDR